jgi:hypothetical protein
MKRRVPRHLVSFSFLFLFLLDFATTYFLLNARFSPAVNNELGQCRMHTLTVVDSTRSTVIVIDLHPHSSDKQSGQLTCAIFQLRHRQQCYCYKRCEGSPAPR